MIQTRLRLAGRASALAAGLALMPTARAQMPVPPTGPAPLLVESASPHRAGPIRRAFHHLGFTLKDRFIGYPEEFVEPPLGASVYETMGVMKSKADAHDFILYRSDFIDGDATLSPQGAQKLSLMAARLPGWMGPLTVEWTPDRPGLAEARRDALVTTLQGAGLPIGSERVLVGPSPYPGLIGPDADSNYRIMLFRDVRAPSNYSVTPTSTNEFGGGNR